MRFDAWIVFESSRGQSRACSIFVHLPHPSAMVHAGHNGRKGMAILNDMANALLHTLAATPGFSKNVKALSTYRDLLYSSIEPVHIQSRGFMGASEALRLLRQEEIRSKKPIPVDQIPKEVLAIYPAAANDPSLFKGEELFRGSQTVLRLLLKYERDVLQAGQGFTKRKGVRQVKHPWSRLSKEEREDRFRRLCEGKRRLHAYLDEHPEIKAVGPQIRSAIRFLMHSRQDFHCKQFAGARAWHASLKLEENVAKKEVNRKQRQVWLNES